MEGSTIQPASEKDAISRRNTLFAAYVEKIFEALKKNGRERVHVFGPLGPRSEIMLGLRKSGESAEETKLRIVSSFAFHYPLIFRSSAIEP